MKLSVVIITFNEERNIERCILSIQQLVDEILVVDSFSKDRTIEICEKYNIKVIQNHFEGHIQQKNFAMQQAQFDWVLSLDADEALSDELTKSIKQIKSIEKPEFVKNDPGNITFPDEFIVTPELVESDPGNITFPEVSTEKPELVESDPGTTTFPEVSTVMSLGDEPVVPNIVDTPNGVILLTLLEVLFTV